MSECSDFSLDNDYSQMRAATENAQRHRRQFCEAYCKMRAWGCEPQSEILPDFKKKDLTVIPSMSNFHIILLKRSSDRKDADKEEFWKNVKEVWNQ